MQKTVNNFYEKTVNSFNVENSEQILLMQKQILSMKKNRFDHCEIQT